MRVYVPSSLIALAEAHEAGELGAGQAYAVTPELRDWYGSDNDEELEYAALGQAARASLRLLADSGGNARRRVVLAADVPDAAVSEASGESSGPGEIRLGAGVPLSRVAAVHADADEAEPDVAAAVSALGVSGGPAGQEDAPEVEALEDHELLWFATQEIPTLLG